MIRHNETRTPDHYGPAAGYLIKLRYYTAAPEAGQALIFPE